MFGVRTDDDKIWGSDASFWSNKPQVEIYKNTINQAVPKDYINSWESRHKCEYEGCFKDGCVECQVPESPLDEYLDTEKNLIEHLCCDHAFKVGYCIVCGEFWGGIEDFDFGNGLCDNCLEDGEPEEDEPLY